MYPCSNVSTKLTSFDLFHTSKTDFCCHVKGKHWKKLSENWHQPHNRIVQYSCLFDITKLKDSTPVGYIYCESTKPLKWQKFTKINLGTDEALKHVSPHVVFGRAYGCECLALCGPCQCAPLVPWCSFWPGVCVRQEHLQNDDLEEKNRREEEGWDVLKKMDENVFELHTPLNGSF